jgi:hypothetical protein
MAVDLEVDTGLLWQAADVLDDASALFDGRTSPDFADYPLTDASLGNSAVAREVVAAAGRRVAQAIESTVLLAALATRDAEKLRAAATAFASTETAIAGQPR